MQSLLGDDDQQHEDQGYVPYATFLLKKLGNPLKKLGNPLKK